MNLRELFRYEDGTLHWTGPGRPPAWTPSGGVPGRRYLKCSLNGVNVYQHHIVWLLHHAELPSRVDHRDRDRSNNRIENLRAADHSQNLRNCRTYSNNTSGFKGVDLHKSTGRYRARLRLRGKEISLGYFATAEQAAAAFAEAAADHYEGFQ
jgi:hypothetical protein